MVDMGAARVQASQFFASPSLCELVSHLEPTLFVGTPAIRIEQHIRSASKVVELLPDTFPVPFTTAVQQEKENIFRYWKAAGAEFTQKEILLQKNQQSDTSASNPANNFLVLLTGRRYTKMRVEFEWYFDNIMRYTFPATISSGTDGEARFEPQFKRDEGTKKCYLDGIVDHWLAVDVSTEKNYAIFESVYLEVLHKIVGQRLGEKIADRVNAGNDPSVEKLYSVIAEYIKYDEIAVHYCMASYMDDMVKRNIVSRGDIIDIYKKYNIPGSTYQGVIRIIEKHPLSIANGQAVLRDFLNDPSSVENWMK